MTNFVSLLEEAQPGHPYVATLETDSDPHALLAEAAVGWLEPKVGPVALDGALELRRENAMLVVRRDEQRLEIELVETNSSGVWCTMLRAVRGHEAGRVQILVVGNHPDGGRSKWTATPRIARDLLASGQLRLGSMYAAERLVVLQPDDVDALVDFLADPDRRAPLLVARVDEAEGELVEPFWKLIDTTTSGVTGMAGVYGMGSAAHARFVELAGHAWSVPAWTMRTFRPRIDLASTSAAATCRILSTDRLARDSERYLKGVIARAVRATAWDIDDVVQWRLEDQVADTLARLAAFQDRPERSASATPVEPAQDEASDEVATLRLTLERVRQSLGLEDLSSASLDQVAETLTAPRLSAEEAEAMSAQISDLSERMAELKARAERAEESQAQAEDEQAEMHRLAETYRKKSVWLEGELRNVGSHAVFVDQAPPPPSSFEDLLARRKELEDPGVVLTCDDEPALELDVLDERGTILTTTWHAIQMCAAFLAARRAGEFDKGMKDFIANPIGDVTPMLTSKHSPTETDMTMSMFGRERRFTVPKSVAKDGWVEMQAHFKLGVIPGFQDGRMHYEHVVETPDGSIKEQIFIGYLGSHLNTAATVRRKLRPVRRG